MDYSDYVTTASNCAYSSLSAIVSGGGIYRTTDYKFNEITKMEIGKTEVFEITLVETKVMEHKFSVVAKNKEDALEIIKKGNCRGNTEFVSSNITEKGF